MADEIKVGDWITYTSSGLRGQGEVVGMDSETITLRLEGANVVAVIGRGGDEKKIPPPDENES